MDFDILTMFISVDRYASKYPSISPYAYCAWNPLKLIDPTGDTITLTHAAWAIQKEAFMSVFDRNEKIRPFSYNNATQRMSYIEENKSQGYSDTQKEIIEHYKALCEGNYNISVQVVSNDELLKTNKGKTTLEKEFAMGMTALDVEKGANVYISRCPLYNYGGKATRRPLRDVYQSIAILHEIGGHAYYYSQNIFGDENNEQTRVFENACRDIFTASYPRGTKEVRKGRASYEH